MCAFAEPLICYNYFFKINFLKIGFLKYEILKIEVFEIESFKIDFLEIEMLRIDCGTLLQVGQVGPTSVWPKMLPDGKRARFNLAQCGWRKLLVDFLTRI